MVDLLPCVILTNTGEVLQVGYQNRKAFQKSLEQGKLWLTHPENGRVLPWEENAHYTFTFRERKNWYEALCKPSSAAPHATAGERAPAEKEEGVIQKLAEVIIDRKCKLPSGSYTTYLFQSGEEKIRKKTGEEAVELILAKSENEMILEAADLLYHIVVLFVCRGIPITTVFQELENRSDQGP